VGLADNYPNGRLRRFLGSGYRCSASTSGKPQIATYDEEKRILAVADPHVRALALLILLLVSEQKAKLLYWPKMGERRKRVLAIVAGILVTRRLKMTDHLFNCRIAEARTSPPVSSASSRNRPN
jgi:hypothetical protein